MVSKCPLRWEGQETTASYNMISLYSIIHTSAAPIGCTEMNPIQSHICLNSLPWLSVCLHLQSHTFTFNQFLGFLLPLRDSECCGASWAVCFCLFLHLLTQSCEQYWLQFKWELLPPHHRCHRVTWVLHRHYHQQLQLGTHFFPVALSNWKYSHTALCCRYAKEFAVVLF